MDLSPGYLLASLLVGTVGLSFFIYGKKQARVPQLVAGLVMMTYPYFVTSPLGMVAIAGGLCAGVWGVTRAGF